jgi:hypothetical protein
MGVSPEFTKFFVTREKTWVCIGICIHNLFKIIPNMISVENLNLFNPIGTKIDPEYFEI